MFILRKKKKKTPHTIQHMCLNLVPVIDHIRSSIVEGADAFARQCSVHNHVLQCAQHTSGTLDKHIQEGETHPGAPGGKARGAGPV